MKKFKSFYILMLGILIGISISYASEIEAATSKLLGQKVQKIITVKKDGKTIGNGAIINGTTYLPVRTVVNSINGLKVGKVSSSEVSLVSNETDYNQKGKEEQEQIDRDKEALNAKINNLRTEIKKVNQEIADKTYNANIEQTSTYKVAKIYVDRYENGEGGTMKESDYNTYKNELAKMDDDKKAAEFALPGLRSNLSNLEAQLAELEG